SGTAPTTSHETPPGPSSSSWGSSSSRRCASNSPARLDPRETASAAGRSCSWRARGLRPDTPPGFCTRPPPFVPRPNRGNPARGAWHAATQNSGVQAAILRSGLGTTSRGAPALPFGGRPLENAVGDATASWSATSLLAVADQHTRLGGWCHGGPGPHFGTSG